MTFEEGLEYGKSRYAMPLVETLGIALLKGDAFLNGTVAGLIQRAREHEYVD